MVKIFSLVENTSTNNNYIPKHGLSFYIESNKHKILFDLGPDNTFYDNALKRGINLEEIDVVILSHGHYDHCGGLPYFLKVNKTAKIYIKKEAFNEHFNKKDTLYRDIGITKFDIDKKRLIFVKDLLIIDDELTLFSNVKGRKLFSSMNSTLYSKENGKRIHKDNFEHEQYLVVSDNDKDILFTGCSHNGVVNIVEKYEELNKEIHHDLQLVIGGFHLFDYASDKYESKESIMELAQWISLRNEKYYTCHCTGHNAYDLLRENTNEKVSYLSCGDALLINSKD